MWNNIVTSSWWFRFRCTQVSKLSLWMGNVHTADECPRQDQKFLSSYLRNRLLIKSSLCYCFSFLMEPSASKGTESNLNMCMMCIQYDVLQRIFGNKCLKLFRWHGTKRVALNWTVFQGCRGFTVRNFSTLNGQDGKVYLGNLDEKHYGYLMTFYD